MADIVGTTVASQRWPAGGKSMVGRRWPVNGGQPTSASNGNVTQIAHYRWTAGGNLPFIATGGPTASCYLGTSHLQFKINILVEENLFVYCIDILQN